MEELFFCKPHAFTTRQCFYNVPLLLEALAPGLVENVLANGRGVEVNYV